MKKKHGNMIDFCFIHRKLIINSETDRKYIARKKQLQEWCDQIKHRLSKEVHNKKIVLLEHE